MKKLLVPLILICALLVPVGMLGASHAFGIWKHCMYRISMAIARHCFPIP